MPCHRNLEKVMSREKIKARSTQHLQETLAINQSTQNSICDLPFHTSATQHWWKGADVCWKFLHPLALKNFKHGERLCGYERNKPLFCLLISCPAEKCSKGAPNDLETKLGAPRKPVFHVVRKWGSPCLIFLFGIHVELPSHHPLDYFNAKKKIASPSRQLQLLTSWLMFT